ncbi:MAG TPA: hypothetical protein PKE06_21685 [Flavilitoribacter sp.]|nr:hypothetical protein [Flavilitoribacter sp.]HMQ86436.1 hypothetical protein [Flavilitoribacter sp.]
MTKQEEAVWRAFYQAAVTFRDLKCWEWMYDTDIFGVENPKTGEIGYCCVMGNAGEVFALGVYTGDEGFKSYLRLLYMPEEIEDEDRVAIGLEQNMLKVEFVDRQELSKPDLDQVKALGLKFRGRNQWVMPREYLPGYFPWFLTTEQAEWMTHALQQAMDVAIRFEDAPSLIRREDGKLLVRAQVEQKGKKVWVDEYREEPFEEESPDIFPVHQADPELAKALKKKLKKKKNDLLFMHQYFPSPVGNQGKRPFFSKISLWASPEGVIIGHNLSFDNEPWEKFEQDFYQQLETVKFIPKRIGVPTVMAYYHIMPIAKILGIELLLMPEYPIFEEFRESFFMHFF